MRGSADVSPNIGLLRVVFASSDRSQLSALNARPSAPESGCSRRSSDDVARDGPRRALRRPRSIPEAGIAVLGMASLSLVERLPGKGELNVKSRTRVTYSALLFRLVGLERRHDDEGRASALNRVAAEGLGAGGRRAKVARVCRRVGISRKSFYKWKRPQPTGTLVGSKRAIRMRRADTTGPATPVLNAHVGDATVRSLWQLRQAPRLYARTVHRRPLG